MSAPCQHTQAEQMVMRPDECLTCLRASLTKITTICHELVTSGPHLEGQFAEGQVVLAGIILKVIDGADAGPQS